MLKMDVLRGLPGSGKSFRASEIHEATGAVVCSADNFMVDAEGNYKFNPLSLASAHESCQELARKSLWNGRSVVIDNTNTMKWEFDTYLEIAKEYDAEVEIIDLFDAGLLDEELAARNHHGVPVEVIEKMRVRWFKG